MRCGRALQAYSNECYHLQGLSQTHRVCEDTSTEWRWGVLGPFVGHVVDVPVP